jgi:hypothetical protein
MDRLRCHSRALIDAYKLILICNTHAKSPNESLSLYNLLSDVRQSEVSGNLAELKPQAKRSAGAIQRNSIQITMLAILKFFV